MSELQGIYLNTNKPLRNKFGVREKNTSIYCFICFFIRFNYDNGKSNKCR